MASDRACAKCHKPIDSGAEVRAVGKQFHSDCLTCANCGKLDMARVFALYDCTYCQQCYEQLLDNFPKCLPCGKTILPTSEYKEFFFHGKKHFVHFPDCFKCKFCQKPMNVKACCVFKDSLLCDKCFSVGQKRICAECNEPVFSNGSRTESIWWHQHHFHCSSCQVELQQNTAVFISGILKCRECWTVERMKCGGCSRLVDKKGVHACGQQWHEECLNCQMCKTNVLTKKFANVRNKPCCIDCYSRLRSEGRIDKRGQLIEESLSCCQSRTASPPSHK